MEQLLSIFFASITTDNIAFTYILGMCPIIALSKKVSTAFGMGISVALVTTLTAIINWCIHRFVLIPTGSDIVAYLIYIIVIATTVQLLEIIFEKYLPSMHEIFGIYLPLITVNCTVLIISLFFTIRYYSFWQTAFFASGSSIGWLLAIVIIAAIREKLSITSDIPEGLKGPGIVMIIIGILALGFMGFAGIADIK